MTCGCPVGDSSLAGTVKRRLLGNLIGAARRRAQPLVRYVRTMGVFLLAWHLASLRMNNLVLLPSPLLVADDLLRMLLSGELLRQAWFSVWRLLVAFALAGLLGVNIGFLMGLSRLVDALIDPLIEVVRPISGIAWIPLALFVFGIGHALPIFIIFYVALFPFVLNAVFGVRSTERLLVRAAQTMGIGRWAIIRRVILPSTVPAILVGARLGATGGWMALIAAEMVGAPSGLGFSIQWYGGLLRTSEMLAMITAVALLGYLTDRGLRRLQRRLTPWAAGMVIAE